MVGWFPARVGSDSGVLIGTTDSKEKANMAAHTIGEDPVNAYAVSRSAPNSNKRSDALGHDDTPETIWRQTVIVMTRKS